MLSWEEEERLEMELDPEAADMQLDSEAADMQLDPMADMNNLDDKQSRFLASLLPFSEDYPMTPATSGLSDLMTLDRDLQPTGTPNSGEPRSPGPSLMLPVVRMRDSESPSPPPSPLARQTALIRPDHVPPPFVSIPIPSPTGTAAHPVVVAPPPVTQQPFLHHQPTPGSGSILAASTLVEASAPATPIPRKLVTYSSNATRALSGLLAPAAASPTSLKLLANQSVMEAIRDENVEARRAAFAALRYGQQSNPTPIAHQGQPGRVPVRDVARNTRATDVQEAAAMWDGHPPVRDSDSAQYVREADVRAAAAMLEGGAARAARKANAERLNAESMRNAEIMAAEAIEKKEKATKLLSKNRAQAASALLAKETAATLHRESQRKDQPHSEGAVTALVATGSQPAVPSAPSVLAVKLPFAAPSNDKERRQNDAATRKAKAAYKKQVDGEAKSKKAKETAARQQKIADVAALSAAAKAAVAPAGGINALTPECPQWMHDAVVELKKDGWFGPEWDGCVKAFVLFEIAMGFADSVSSFFINSRCDHRLTLSQGSHGNDVRPKEIAHWIKSYRHYDKPPLYHDKYGATCIAWWMHIQPAWRKSEGDLPHAIYACDDGDWGALRKSGKNGVFMVLLSVAWWARGLGKVSPLWVSMVTDMRRALESMTESRDALAAETRNMGASTRPRPSRPGTLKRGVENSVEAPQRPKRQVILSYVLYTETEFTVSL